MSQIGICGVGFVGGALKYSFDKLSINYCLYDKYKELGNFNSLLTTDIVFLCLPTLYDETFKKYDTSALEEITGKLSKEDYSGVIVIKSTVTTGYSESLNRQFPTLKIIHNPEFLTARTANEDFHHQEHIVLGKTSFCGDLDLQRLYDFYHQNYPKAEISKTSSGVSESMKSFCNTFYSVKIAFFNELYQYCQAKQIDYPETKRLMLKNGWINPMHTEVPGPDGKFGFGGACFPKDTSALLEDMKNEGTANKVLDAVINENIEIRNGDPNNKLEKILLEKIDNIVDIQTSNNNNNNTINIY